jgi:hypothetical protein
LQEERRWKLIPEQCIPSSLVCLQSLDLDVDGAIMHFSAASPCTNLVQLMADIKATFSVEMSEKCVTSYVPRGKQWRFCVKAEHKPTIFQKGVYMRLPQPENTTEVVKISLHTTQGLRMCEELVDNRVPEAAAASTLNPLSLCNKCSTAGTLVLCDSFG